MAEISLNLRCERVAADAVEPLQAILAACGADLRDRLGLDYWDPPYPLEALRRDAVERAVYAVQAGGQLAATFTAGTTPPYSYFEAANWLEPAARALYISRLGVLPALQGQGIGVGCLAAIERLARDGSCAAVRFDAFAGHPALLRFYDLAGYERRGTVQWQNGGEGVLFEKHLPGSTAVIVGEEREGR
jgi:GNAT superfamily N-acetyltransferase